MAMTVKEMVSRAEGLTRGEVSSPASMEWSRVEWSRVEQSGVE
jgi:hypothetical protein